MATVYEASVLASTSYGGSSPGPVPAGWKLLQTNDGKPLIRVDAKSGFEAVAYRNEVTGEIAVSYVGTNDWGDVFGTYPGVISGSMPIAQFQQAVDFHNEVMGVVRERYPDASVVLTGHSLGGLLAQAVSVVLRRMTGFAVPTVTFEAPGARSAIEEWLHKPIDGLTSQITNYVHPSDLVGTFRDHAGEVRYWGGIEGPGVGELPLGVQILASPVLVLAAAPSIFLTHRIANAVEWFRDDPEGQRVIPGSAPPVQSSDSVSAVGVPFQVNSESSTVASGVVTNATSNWFDTLSAPSELGFVAPPTPPPVPAPVVLPSAPDLPTGDPSVPPPDPAPLPPDPVPPPTPDAPLDTQGVVMEIAQPPAVDASGSGDAAFSSASSAGASSDASTVSSATGAGASSDGNASTVGANGSSAAADAALAGHDGVAPIDTGSVVTDIVQSPAGGDGGSAPGDTNSVVTASAPVDQLGSQAALNGGEGALIPEDVTLVQSGVGSALTIASIVSSDLPDDQKGLQSASGAAGFTSQAVGATTPLGETLGEAGVALDVAAIVLSDMPDEEKAVRTAIDVAAASGLAGAAPVASLAGIGLDLASGQPNVPRDIGALIKTGQTIADLTGTGASTAGTSAATLPAGGLTATAPDILTSQAPTVVSGAEAGTEGVAAGAGAASEAGIATALQGASQFLPYLSGGWDLMMILVSDRPEAQKAVLAALEVASMAAVPFTFGLSTLAVPLTEFITSQPPGGVVDILSGGGSSVWNAIFGESGNYLKKRQAANEQANDALRGLGGVYSTSAQTGDPIQILQALASGQANGHVRSSLILPADVAKQFELSGVARGTTVDTEWSNVTPDQLGQVLNYFAADPTRLNGAVGGSGDVPYLDQQAAQMVADSAAGAATQVLRSMLLRYGQSSKMDQVRQVLMLQKLTPEQLSQLPYTPETNALRQSVLNADPSVDPWKDPDGALAAYTAAHDLPADQYLRVGNAKLDTTHKYGFYNVWAAPPRPEPISTEQAAQQLAQAWVSYGARPQPQNPTLIMDLTTGKMLSQPVTGQIPQYMTGFEGQQVYAGYSVEVTTGYMLDRAYFDPQAPDTPYTKGLRGEAERATAQVAQTDDWWRATYGGGGDPVVLDLNEDGVLLQPAAKSGVDFDLNGDGSVERIAWVQPEDGLLALDRDGDGKITSGRELFSEFFDPNHATTGLGALGLFDANHDRVIDTKDPVFGQLRVWQDANRDARTGPGELRTLDALGISSIQLAGRPANEPVDGGRIITRTTFIQNGTAMDAADMFFATEGESFRSAEAAPNGEAINLAAGGPEVDDTRVEQLRQAMAAFAPPALSADMTLPSDIQHQLTPTLAAWESGHS